MSSNDQLQALARFILPEDILDNFDIVGIKQLGEELHIHLDEQLILGHQKNYVFDNFLFQAKMQFAPYLNSFCVFMDVLPDYSE